MGYDVGDTFSVWVDQQRVAMLNEFDSYYRLQLGADYGIGDQTKQAMWLKLEIDKALDEAGIDLDERGKRAYIRQLILDDAAAD
jgi:hypothetical protein